MVRKHSMLLAIMVSVLLLIIATLYYPGGSQLDKNSIGYDWKNNYISNLFNKTAISGSDNPSRYWAVFGMLFLSISFAFFFADFSKKIANKGAARVIKLFGIAAMIFAFLTVTPYHDIMVTISGTLVLVSMFYVTVFLFKSKLHFLKVLSVVCLLVFYCCDYIYYTGTYLTILPIMQKVCFLTIVIWMLLLQYFTTINDFQPKRKLLR
ncbi:MAG TPA: hypothetical protein VNS32_08605 [Flavisolibacter sp.]|nr:hypothetical protein [Flavisolibacter sp.]